MLIEPKNYIPTNTCKNNFEPIQIKNTYYIGFKSTIKGIFTAIWWDIKSSTNLVCKVKPVLSGHSKIRLKIVFQDPLSLNAGQKYCRILQVSILEYFQPSLSYHLTIRPFLSVFEWLLKSGFTVIVCGSRQGSGKLEHQAPSFF